MIAPLEWGLGHATRCVPLITELLTLKCEVFIAAEGAGYFLLKKEFPEVTFLSLKGYRIHFSKNSKLLFITLFCQAPKILYTIYREHVWLKKIIKNYNLIAVISDNRFGLHNKKIRSVYITHQLLIKTGNKITDNITQHIHSFFIKKYAECWVPDYKKNDLAGELSHPAMISRNVKYIGALSRFEKRAHVEKIYDLLITISGPEPQRTLFEDILLRNLENYSGNVLLVRGLPASLEIVTSKNASVVIKNHLSGEELGNAIQQSAIVISRSGYTSIMDLVKLNKKAILVPAPGQTEQEYLAAYLMKNKIFFSVSQKDFDLNETLVKFSLFVSAIPEFDMQQYKSVIHEFVASLSSESIAGN